MQKEEIEITLFPDGRLEYTIKGIKGAACDGLSELLEQIGKVESAERTGEYYERERSTDIHIDRT